jgi:hypothetical protein
MALPIDRTRFEDLNLTGMKALWGHKVSDLGFSDYLGKQKWMCDKYGRLFGQMPRFEPFTKRMSLLWACQGTSRD